MEYTIFIILILFIPYLVTEIYFSVVLDGLVPKWWSNPNSAPKGAEGASGYAEACALGLQLPDLGSGFQLLNFKSQDKV